MPHTSRKNRTAIPSQKRLQITDDAGWTHVTSGSNVRRLIRSTNGTPVKNENGSKGKGCQDGEGQGEMNQYNHEATHIQRQEQEQDLEPVLNPAEAPARLTFGELQTQYAVHRAKWISSETWRRLKVRLQGWMGQRMRAGGREALDGSERLKFGPVDAIVCIGLGSPSGFLRDGWVDRRTVSMYQLAALESIKELLSYPQESESNTDTRTDILPLSFPIYAQDPVFNTHDKSLLTSLGIKPLTTPKAFNLVTKNTLLFCPGAEKKHLELVLPSKPCAVLGGPLEDTGSGVIQNYLQSDGLESLRLVGFEECEHAFWRVGLYLEGLGEGDGC